MRREKQFNMLSFKNRFAYTGINQQVSYEIMFRSFAVNYKRTKETVLEYQKGNKQLRDNALTKYAKLLMQYPISIISSSDKSATNLSIASLNGVIFSKLFAILALTLR